MEIKKNKKIIFKIAEFPHTSETFIINQVVTAIELGYEVSILVYKKLDFSKSLHKELLEKYDIENKIIYEQVIIPSNYIIRLLNIAFLFIKNIMNTRKIYNYYRFQNKWSLSWIFYWVFYNKLDAENTIFHIQYGNNKYPFDILKARCDFKAKVITTFHGHDAFFPMYGKISNNGYYNLLFESANLITANTTYLANKIEELQCPLDKLKIIPVGVDTYFFNSLNKVKNTDSILRLINVGRLDPVKGQRYLIEFVNQIIKKRVSVHLNIIGEGEERSNLEELIKVYNLSENVTLVGKKSQTEIKEMYLHADLYVFAGVPLPDGRRETQGLATLEAQACGLPVLAYDSGGIKYTIDENVTGFLFNEYEIDKVVAKLIFLNENRNVIQQMSENCYKFVSENYSQKVINEKWSNIYSNL